MDEHLTDEQFLAIFLGEELDSHSKAHLAECKQCGQNIASTKSGLEGFQELGTSWAETEAPHAVYVPSRFTVQVGARTGWAWALTALATCATVIALVPKMHTLYPKDVASVQAEPNAAQLERDNQWLQAMDRDLREGPDSISVPTTALAPAGIRTKRLSSSMFQD